GGSQKGTGTTKKAGSGPKRGMKATAAEPAAGAPHGTGDSADGGSAEPAEEQVEVDIALEDGPAEGAGTDPMEAAAESGADPTPADTLEADPLAGEHPPAPATKVAEVGPAIIPEIGDE